MSNDHGYIRQQPHTVTMELTRDELTTIRRLVLAQIRKAARDQAKNRREGWKPPEGSRDMNLIKVQRGDVIVSEIAKALGSLPRGESTAPTDEQNAMHELARTLEPHIGGHVVLYGTVSEMEGLTPIRSVDLDGLNARLHRVWVDSREDLPALCLEAIFEDTHHGDPIRYRWTTQNLAWARKAVPAMIRTPV